MCAMDVRHPATALANGVPGGEVAAQCESKDASAAILLRAFYRLPCPSPHLRRSDCYGTQTYILWGYGDTGKALRRALLAHGKVPLILSRSIQAA